MKTIVGGHTLSTVFTLNKKTPLRNLIRAIVSRRGTLLEIPFILCKLNWDDVGNIAKSMGIKEISLCHFWVRNNGVATWGDPLGNDQEISLAHDTYRKIFAAVETLRKYVIVRFIDGPAWGALGFDYGLPAGELRSNVISGLKTSGELCAKHDLILAVESLRRDPEDLVTGGTLKTISILHAVNMANVKFHGDLFHMLSNCEDPVSMMQSIRDYVVYLHLHGKGRRAPGARGNGVDWGEVSNEVHLISSGIENIPILAEPFGKLTCEENKELGKGIPPMGPLPKYFNTTFKTYREVELLAA